MQLFDRIARTVGFERKSPAPRIEPAVTAHGPTVVGSSVRRLPTKNTAELLAAYRESPILQMVARKVAEGVAQTEWHALARLEDGRTQRVPGHIMEILLNSGVPGLDGFRCKMVTELHCLLSGETGWILDRNALGKPVRRWPIPPHWFAEIAMPGRPWYKVYGLNGGNALELPARDVVFIKDVDPLDPYGRGAGIGRALIDELLADEGAAKHTAATFRNDAVPRTIITGAKESPLESEDITRIEELWLQKYGGAENAGQPFFSRRELMVNRLAMGFADLDMRNIREFERDIIISVFGVPPELVGVLQNSNRATIESAEFLFTKHVVVPRLEAQRVAINDQLAWQYDTNLEAGYENPVDEDMAFRADMMKARGDAFTLDEIRESTGLDPLPEEAGRRIAVPFTNLYMEPTELGGSGIMNPAPLATETGEEDEEEYPDEEATLGMMYEGVNASTRAMLTKAADDADPAEIAGAAEASESLISDILERATGEAARDFAEAQLAQLNVRIAFDIRDPRRIEFLKARAAERSSLIVGHTRTELQKEMAEGVAAGENTDQLVRRIRRVVLDAGRARARVISRTEITRASNYGTDEALKEAGVQRRQWLATFDGNVRDRHAALDGQVRDIGDPFEIDGMRAMYPGDFGVAAMDINCRCGVTPVIDGAEVRRGAIWKTYDLRRGPHERLLEQRMNTAFARMAGDVMARLFVREI